MHLPVEIIDQIVLMTKSFKVAHALKDFISKKVYEECDRNILIYGQVQSGKTKEIIKVLKGEDYKDETKVLVIQNSLMVLKQYCQRLRNEGVEYQVVTKTTSEINKGVVIVMNNKFRYTYFKNITKDTHSRYILLLDESDQTSVNCPLLVSSGNFKTFHITATPFHDFKYDRIIICKDDNPNYYGIDKIDVEVVDDMNDTVREFLSTSKGMMLINKYVYVEDMKETAHWLSKKHPKIPIVLLTSHKTLYLNNKVTKIRGASITKIIDTFTGFNHIIFIANRMSNRGLSYVSSDYTRHLTYQITRVKNNVTRFLQSLRILGRYTDNPTLKLVIDSTDETMFNKHMDFIKNFKVRDYANE